MNSITTLTTDLIEKLTLEEKVAFISGFDFWNTVPNEKIGLRKMLLSDGPAGVRGEFWDERDNSLNLPSSTALASSWSTDFAAEYGRTLAAEAQRKGVDVVLGPTINLHRSPLGGRHFECLSEDAMLTGALAASLIQSIQENGIGTCPKHYVANDFETDRYNVDVRVDERALNEVYLRPFEDAVVKGGAWTIMSSYNKVNGTTLTESDLLQDPLRSEWGFDGVVISDWNAVRTLAAAGAEQDLAMPGPDGAWGAALVEAVRRGEIQEEVINRKVARLLLLAQRVGALGEEGELPDPVKRHNHIAPEGVSFARRAAAEGSVLLENDGVLPLNFKKIGKVALIGHNASAARTQGGGSATVMPKTVVTPLDALRHELGANLIYEVGAVVQEGVLELPGAELQNPKTGKPGVRVDFIDQNGEVSFSEDRLSSGLIWLGAAVPLPKSALLEIQTIYTPTQSGSVLLGYASAQPVSLEVDGVEFLSAHLQSRSDDPFTTIMDPPHTSKEINLIAGQSYHLRAKVDLSGREGVSLRSQNFVLGLETDGSLGDGLIESAVKQAEEADLAIVVVGTNAQVESEGFDRSDLSLPGRQNELVEAVLAVNPNTIIIVNSGSPVLMPWRHKARAILLSYFGGQEMGNGLMDVLSGVTEPGGRLPTTWPDKLEHVPVLNCLASQPGNYVDYEEGIHIGYRAWLKQGTKPAYEFGYGLGYTTWSIEAVKVPTQSRPGKDLKALVSVKNTGNRAGKHVVQIYASRTDSTIDRPVRWLVGFAVVYAQPGEKVLAEVSISGREFAHWSDGWKYEPGKYELHIGTSVERLELQTSIEIGWV